MSNSPESISDFIVEVLKQSGNINGVALGQRVHRDLSDVNFSRYGGLNKFIRTFCSQDIAFDRTGDDYIYSLKSEDDKDANHTDASEEPQLSAWRVFSSPKSSSSLLINNLTGEISIVDGGDDVAEGYTHLPPLTSEDYRIIARDFLPLVTDEVLRNELQQDLLAEDFWSTFSTRLREHKEAFSAWRKWRSQKVLELFRMMLNESGLSDDTVNLAAEYMEKSRVARPKPTAPQTNRASLLKTQPTNRNTGRGGNNKPSDKSYTRQLTTEVEVAPSALHAVIHQAINNLSEGELRRIWLPIGAILDALNKNSS